ncbi:uncharacterized protein BYT42DRAFT_562076 [Radiomyces spectabilis]|uniref:uncharacterized protein n=1 Tax=Radiomyces spectabilis TaxID=64574 RepID=UPI00221F5E3D|nr:uncharacterized protein BYT42DRAFT_562076 [Radiomyces spectabilis]KAI8384309.1 hypothetical protein BYT42DRAFT_562076 [Radiomyces spectabilis]
MPSHRSPSSSSRRRSPSPSSKRQKRSHYRDRSPRDHRDRSRDRHRDRSREYSDRHRHSSSSHRHRSSRHDDRSHRDYNRSSRHYDDVSAPRERSSSHHTSSRVRTESPARDGNAAETSPGIGHTHTKADESPAATNHQESTASPQAPTTESKDDVLRKRQERLEKWKQQQRQAKLAEEQAKAAAENEQKQEETKSTAEPVSQELNKPSKTDASPPAIEIPAVSTTDDQSSARLEDKIFQDSLAAARQMAGKDETDEKMGEEHQAAAMEEDSHAKDKGWSWEDEDEDETMDVDMEEHAQADAERSFKPLKQDNKDDEGKEDSFVTRRPIQQQRNMFMMGGNRTGTAQVNNAAPKPAVTAKNTMRIGFGLGKKATKPVIPSKPAVTPAPKTEVKSKTTTAMEVDTGDDVDPLEAYMRGVTAEARKIDEEDKKRMEDVKPTVILADDDAPEAEPADNDDDVGSDAEDILALAAKKAKRKDIAPVDHSTMHYEFFRKDFYIEPPELKDMTPDQVELLRMELDGIKIRGVNCPKPIQKWTHCGLPAGCLEVIRKLKFEKPTSIQAQAVPAIMNGRDVIGVAKTGSGKTIAFLLPMFRHIKDQRSLEMGEGPIAVIMTPTRELATQIHRECKPFLKVLGLRAVCAYGGSPIKDQIADLKRGCEIVVCTPGRMIDLLCANSGRVTNLKRVTYMVLDEADRMFDMGFEPQVMKIVNNVRPSRQTVLFSATFPRQMEALARKVLKKPLEITVGGRSVVCNDVEQIVEVREENTKFIRLLEILGEFFNVDEEEDSRALVFVDRHEAADNLLRDLIRRGYPCQSLHGGKDQADRDSTIADFKSGVTNILIATSVAARGLDVKQLKLVVNYECPNHMEDYVHRVGRTGRAGNKGTAYTFITPDQDRYAMDICKALRLSGQEIPPDLQKLTDHFQEKVKAGKERMASSGFGGKGLERLDKDRDLVKKIQKKAYGGEDLEESDEEEAAEIETKLAPPTPATTIKVEEPQVTTVTSSPGQAAAAAAAAAASAAEAGKGSDEQLSAAALAAQKAAAQVAARINAMAGNKNRSANDVLADINARFRENTNSAQAEGKDGNPVFAEEMVINDFPQKARWRVTNREQISQITEISGAAITTRGTFFPPGKQPGPNERKLYLFIEGDSELVVEKARNEIKRILMEATVAQLEAEARTGGGSAGRYSVV